MTIPAESTRVTAKPEALEKTGGSKAQDAASVRKRLLMLMYHRATDLNRPRVAPKSHSAAKGPLHNNGGFIGWGVIDLSKEMTKEMGRHVGPHEVTHVLYDLRKLQLVKFKTTKSPALIKRVGEMRTTGSHANTSNPNGIPTRIQITKLGRKRAEDQQPQMDDPVDYIRTAVKRRENSGGTVPPALPEPPPDPKARYEYVPGSTALRFEEDAEQPGQSRDDGTFVPLSMKDFPEITRVSAAASLVKDAAELLTMAGQNDLATMATEELAKRSQLELEVHDFVIALVEAGAIRYVVAGYLRHCNDVNGTALGTTTVTSGEDSAPARLRGG